MKAMKTQPLVPDAGTLGATETAAKDPLAKTVETNQTRGQEKLAKTFTLSRADIEYIAEISREIGVTEKRSVSASEALRHIIQEHRHGR